MSPVCYLLLLVVVLAGCSHRGGPARAPSDAEIHSAVEAHVHKLVGNAFRGVTIIGLRREEPVEQFVPQLNAKVMTYPISYALHVDTTKGAMDDPPHTTTYYRNGQKWAWLVSSPKT